MKSMKEFLSYHTHKSKRTAAATDVKSRLLSWDIITTFGNTSYHCGHDTPSQHTLLVLLNSVEQILFHHSPSKTENLNAKLIAQDERNLTVQV